MRFSIRWLLAITAYIALLAATIGTQNSILVDLVWVVTLVAFCYAVVVAYIDRGKRQALAIGFIALAAVHVGCLYLSPMTTPAIRVYQALGYVVDGSNLIYERVDPNANVGHLQSALYKGTIQRTKGYLPDVRTSNGVVTLAAGLVGCLIGRLAYKHNSGT